MPAGIISTVGLEFESIISTRDDILKRMKLRGKESLIKTITRDASVESVCTRIGSNSSLFMGTQAIVSRLMKKNPDQVMGFEIVTQPLDIETMRKTIDQVINVMIGSGEIFSPRSSIHVHVGYPGGLIFLKTGLKTALRAEPLLFKLAGMGRPYRGSINHSNYARPLELPPVIQTTSGRYVAMNPEGALDTDGIIDFWGKFGTTPLERNRYTPARYFAINLFSILLRGTVEYRFFNYCSNPAWVESITALCQMISEIMFRTGMRDLDSLPRLSIFESNSDGAYINLLEELDRLARYHECEFALSREDMESLVEIISSTPQPIFERELVKTHLKDWRIDDTVATVYGLKTATKCIPPGIEDIHNFAEKDRSLI